MAEEDDKMKKKKKSKKQHGKSKAHKDKKGKSKDKHTKKSKKSKKGKKEKREKGSHDKKKLPAALPPISDENLGDVVLVKNAKKGGSKGKRRSGSRPPTNPAGTPRKLSKEKNSASKGLAAGDGRRGPAATAAQAARTRPTRLPPTPTKPRLQPNNRPQQAMRPAPGRISKEVMSPANPTYLTQGDFVRGTLGRGAKSLPTTSGEPDTITTTPTPQQNRLAATPSREFTRPEREMSADDLTRKETNDATTGEFVDKREKWTKYVEKLIEGGPEGIHTEFRNVRASVPSAATRFAFDSNPQKNRFEDMICVDHTRFQLRDESYIHASWVEINEKRKAILTQLPLPSTASDFWQMVLESSSQSILLLLTHFEYLTFNASATFPGEKDFLHFADRHIRVGECRRVRITPDWTMHVYTITNGEIKKYVHLHAYTAWSHGMAPKTTTDMWQIQSVLRRYSHPHIYVSLSGCGRAGTWAVFEMAHDRLHNDNSARVNVPECVQRVRNGRMHALQRPGQMKAVYVAIAEHIVNNGVEHQLQPKQTERLMEIIRSQ